MFAWCIIPADLLSIHALVGVTFRLLLLRIDFDVEINDVRCPLHQSAIESAVHLFMVCLVAQIVWSQFEYPIRILDLNVQLTSQWVCSRLASSQNTFRRIIQLFFGCYLL